MFGAQTFAASGFLSLPQQQSPADDSPRWEPGSRLASGDAARVCDLLELDVTVTKGSSASHNQTQEPDNPVGFELCRAVRDVEVQLGLHPDGKVRRERLKRLNELVQHTHSGGGEIHRHFDAFARVRAECEQVARRLGCAQRALVAEQIAPLAEELAWLGRQVATTQQRRELFEGATRGGAQWQPDMPSPVLADFEVRARERAAILIEILTDAEQVAQSLGVGDGKSNSLRGGALVSPTASLDSSANFASSDADKALANEINQTFSAITQLGGAVAVVASESAGRLQEECEHLRAAIADLRRPGSALQWQARPHISGDKLHLQIAQQQRRAVEDPFDSADEGLRSRFSRETRALQEALEEQLKRSARVDSDVVGAAAARSTAPVSASFSQVYAPAAANRGLFPQAGAGQAQEATWGATTIGATQKKKKQTS